MLDEPEEDTDSEARLYEWIIDKTIGILAILAVATVLVAVIVCAIRYIIGG